MLDRLRKKHDAASMVQERVTAEQQLHQQSCSNQKQAINWTFCMFWQEKGTKSIQNVSTMELSEKMITLAQQDQVMRVRLTNISDLVAAEGKYHLKCWVQFQGKKSKSKTKPHTTRHRREICRDQICTDVLTGLTSGHVYDMGTVWLHYCKMCAKANIQLPRRHITRRKLFHDDIQEILGEKVGFLFVQLIQKSISLYTPATSLNL